MDSIQNSNIDYTDLDIIGRIKQMAKSMNAIIAAHYYQDDDIQSIADVTGDSLKLAMVGHDSDVVVFCGVRFMAEVVKIMNPEKLVLIPDLNAGCSLEESCNPVAFREFRRKNPDLYAVSYINCSAEVKALSDVIVTSSNAEKVINKIATDKKILFSPDRHLGAYLARKTGRDMVLWPGSCMVHERFSMKDLVQLMKKYPDAHVIAHPECPENILSFANHIGSTSSLLSYVEKRNGDRFIVLTEPGIGYKMKALSPNSEIHFVGNEDGGSCNYCNVCPHMRLNTIEKVYDCMVNRYPYIEVDAEVAEGARRSLNNMFNMIT